MQVRASCARPFYPSDCAQSAQRFLKGFSPPTQPGRVVGGIVPHAAWQYSGAVAAKVFASIREKETPETFVDTEKQKIFSKVGKNNFCSPIERFDKELSPMAQPDGENRWYL